MAADAPTTILTIAPLSILREARDLLVTRDNAVLPTDISGIRYAIGLHGVVMFPPADDETSAVSGWAINHRRGDMDIAWVIGRETPSNGSLVFRRRFEKALDDLVRNTMARLTSHGLDGPWVAMATIRGAMGYRILLGDDYPTDRAWQDPAYLGEVVADTLSPESLGPFYERFWRLFGREKTRHRGGVI